MNVTKLRQKGQNRIDARRFEWSALFAVALLLVAFSPSFAASALAMSPSFSGPVSAISTTPSKGCSDVLQWFQAAQNSRVQAPSHFALEASPKKVAIETARPIQLPQFAAPFETAPVAAPAFDFPRQHAPHIFAVSLHHHEAAYLNGVRNNRSID